MKAGTIKAETSQLKQIKAFASLHVLSLYCIRALLSIPFYFIDTVGSENIDNSIDGSLRTFVYNDFFFFFFIFLPKLFQ